MAQALRRLPHDQRSALLRHELRRHLQQREGLPMKPGDYIIYPTPDHVTEVWKISGVFHGAIGQESVVGLVPAIRNPATAYGEDIKEMFVPWSLVCDHVFARDIGDRNLRGAK